MKTIILISLCLCLLATAISADKSHKHQGKLLKSGPEEAAEKDETDIKNHSETKPEHSETKAGEKAEAKPAVGTGRKHRQNHHGKNKKGAVVSNTEAHNGGHSRKVHHSKPNKHNGQRSHNNKHHGRKHGRGKQTQ